MVSLNEITELNEKVIKRIVETHRGSELPRLIKLEKYYETKNEINNR